MPMGIPEATECVRQYKAHQIARLLLDPLITPKQIKYITDDLILKTDVSGHQHVPDELDLWKLDAPNVVLNALAEHYFLQIPEYTASTLINYLTQNCYNVWKTDAFAFIKTYHRLLVAQNLSSQDLRTQFEWMTTSNFNKKYTTQDGLETSHYRLYGSANCLTLHDACPADVLLKLCSDEDWVYRDEAVRHPNCPKEGKIAAALMGTR